MAYLLYVIHLILDYIDAGGLLWLITIILAYHSTKGGFTSQPSPLQRRFRFFQSRIRARKYVKVVAPLYLIIDWLEAKIRFFLKKRGSKTRIVVGWLCLTLAMATMSVLVWWPHQNVGWGDFYVPQRIPLEVELIWRDVLGLFSGILLCLGLSLTKPEDDDDRDDEEPEGDPQTPPGKEIALPA